MIQDTSLEAFDSIKPELGDRQQQVFDVISDHKGCSNLCISRILGIPINCVTPRVKELRDKCLVVFSHYVKDRVTNRRVMVWKVV